MYQEVETILDWFPEWGLDGAKRLTVRERQHWFKRVSAKIADRNKPKDGN